MHQQERPECSAGAAHRMLERRIKELEVELSHVESKKAELAKCKAMLEAAFEWDRHPTAE